MKNATMNLFDDEPVFRKFLPKINEVEGEGVQINEWDIPSTIKELSYLTHSHYRYYGKFPSAVAGQILEQLSPPSNKHYVIDNFCGSGTTLVEAKLRGIKSYGIDINWLAVLASNVKVSYVDIEAVKEELSSLIAWFEANQANFEAPDDAFSQKWFEEEASRDLYTIRAYIYDLVPSNVKDFLVVAFIGIIRRVSKAHNAEVRPHINKKKVQRDVLPAFSKKVNDMCKTHSDFLLTIGNEIESEAILGDNLKLPEKFDDGLCYLAISHPPYLNSFNYAPVFNLELYWGEIFEDVYTNGSKKLYKTEMKAHPANEELTQQYFNHLRDCYKETYRIQKEGAFLAVVIGDCTRLKKLVPVIDKTIEIVKAIGYELIEINYRTTHYGLGKYAYRHRADYHGDQEEKRDAIIIFKK